MLKKVTLTLIIALAAYTTFAQKSPLNKEVQSDFDIDNTVRSIIEEINKVRIQNGVDSVVFNEVLAKASAIQAEHTAEKGKADLENSSGKYKTTAKRVISVGGTKNAEELVLSVAIQKDKKNMSPKEVANAAVAKWLTGKKEPGIIKNGNYVYASPSIKLDETGKKAFISVVFGSFNTFNPGVKKRKELKVRFTKKNKKIKTPDEKSCKNCDKFKDYEGLLDGLYVENGKIFLKYDDLKSLTKLISKPGDGIAVDIVQRAQYEKPDYNIMNNNLLSKGVLTKTVSKDKLLSKNRVKPEEGKKKIGKLDAEIGKLPKKLKGDMPYEMNLLIIQGGKLCKTLIKSYVEQGEQDATTTLKLLLMPDSNAYFKPPFSPKADDAMLNFTLPFEKNKFEYKESDITPFLNALQEPDFIITGLYITAYSSIEGDAAANVKLQKKRSESIIQAMSKLQKQGAVTTIKTSDSWELFKKSMAGTPYDTLAKMTKENAIKEINTKPGLSEELEPYLSKQRFGEIVMDITYDIKGPKEEKFSISKFNQAAKKKDITLAYKIQYYIGKQVREKKYTPEALSKLEIPAKDPKFSGVLNNQVVLKTMAKNDVVDDEDYEQMKKLSALDPSNNIVAYNTIYCAIKLDSTVGDSKNISEMQNKINALYKSEIPKKKVDALNIEWQFKIIDEKNTEEGSEPIIQACIEKVKSFYNLKESSWQNNLKLAYVFARFKDYRYAASLLTDFVRKDQTNEQLLFAYISFCAQVPELIKSRTFVTALQKAEMLNRDKYCKLFGAPYLTFQVFDNPFVKENYNKSKCN
ncbi:MAG: hypothetical protein WAQ28_20860 [Bacteroidia bacterium]|jgi:hypothetical protein